MSGESSLPNNLSRRKVARVSVVPEEILGILIRKSSMDYVPFLMWDISSGGVGIWTAAALEKDEEVLITLGKPYLVNISAKVAWNCKTEREDCFRVGLWVDEADTEKLATLYEKYIKIENNLKDDK